MHSTMYRRIRTRVCASAPVVCLSICAGHHILLFFGWDRKVAKSHGRTEVGLGHSRTPPPGEPLVSSQLVSVQDTLISSDIINIIIIIIIIINQHDACQPTLLFLFLFLLLLSWRLPAWWIIASAWNVCREEALSDTLQMRMIVHALRSMGPGACDCVWCHVTKIPIQDIHSKSLYWR